MPKNTLPEWEIVLSSAARLQRILPDAVLVGGTASAIHAKHRFSRDADHVLTDLRSRFDAVLAELESVAGWKTARVQRPVQIDVMRRVTISISWLSRITWVMIKWGHHCNGSTICTPRKAVNPRCNSCKYNCPTLSHSI